MTKDQLITRASELEQQKGVKVHVLEFNNKGTDVRGLMWEPHISIKVEVMNAQILKSDEFVFIADKLIERLVLPESDKALFEKKLIRKLIVDKIVSTVQFATRADETPETIKVIQEQAEAYGKQYDTTVLGVTCKDSNGNEATMYVRAVADDDILHYSDAQFKGEDYLFLGNNIADLIVGDNADTILANHEMRLTAIINARLACLVELDKYKKK
jgi:antitoxin component HigA of HigAB toxin-antitoxin module